MRGTVHAKLSYFLSAGFTAVLRRQFQLSFLALIALFLQTGCGESGPALEYVTGTLKKGGEPLASVSVTFHPVAGGVSSAGRTDSEGRFVLISQSGKEGAVAGEHKVTLQQVQETGGGGSGGGMDTSRMQEMMKARQSGGSKNSAPEYNKGSVIPPEYESANKTTLKYTVNAGGGDFDISLP